MKYEHVKIVAKTPCPVESRVTGPAGELHVHPAVCRCKGTGEIEQELLHPGEPFFLLRGQDQLAVPIIIGYENLANFAGASTEGLRELIGRLQDWQASNPGLTKLPD